MQPPRQTDRAFGLTFAGLLTVVFLIALFGFEVRLDWALWVAGVFAALAVGAPGVLLPLNRLWFWFAARLGHFSNYVVLGLFLYVIMTPTGLALRMFGWDPMGRRGATSGSYWKPISRKTDAETLRDMF